MTGHDTAHDTRHGSGHDAGGATEPRPLLRVLRGRPSDEELAALAVVLAARAARAAQAAQPAAAPRRGAWADRARLLRGPVRPGPGAWRASAAAR